ncbi:CRAL/TRIO domain-containing protein [Obba rivulosa]|uniref:CRAL/TRIO domain-containing protein n=1 Tax=Obba rivulosa TaxID=1052685 RepID=A0A8E2AXS5_9APHY|nr:CRAL/TRIO domain-containing protein [Obba rivulosa]
MSISETIYEPLSPPGISNLEASEKEPAGLQLSDDKKRMADEILAHFTKEDYTIPGIENGELSEDEKFWLSHECMLRFLRAVKWSSAPAAIKRLEETLIWRREYGVYDVITTSHVEPEALTGKMMLFGYDADRRPAMYLRPSRQNTAESIRQVHLVVWYLERAAELMGPGVETIALMVDYADKAKNPSFSQARAVLNILQTHYPERLGRALIVNLPFLLSAFFKMITPFVDPVTRPKMRFNPECVREGLFTPEQLLKEWGGELLFEYDHERYWKALVQMCEERRARLMDEWRKRGANVGTREWDIKMAVEGAGAQNAETDPQPEAEVEETKSA